MKLKNLLTGALLALSTSVAAQQNNVIDEVIWVVGDEAILRSDVEKARQQMQRLNGNPYCVIPENLALQKLFLHQAVLDSIEVNDETVNRYVEGYLNEWVQMAGSREKLEEYRGMTFSQIREETFDMVKDNQIMEEMRRELTKDIKVTPAEVRHFFKDMPEDSLPLIPTQVEVELLTEHPRIQQEEIDRVKGLLREYSERINNGEMSFSTMARMYSEDTGSARQGGEMDYMSKMDLDPAFANVAWTLNDPSKVSKIVESKYGYHIIQLVDKRGDKLKLRHILKKPLVDQKDVDACLSRLDSIIQDIKEGKFTFEDAASLLSDDKDSRSNHGLMTNVAIDEVAGERIRTSRFKMSELPSEIARVVEGLDIGEISKPFTMIDKAGKQQCCVVKLKNRIKAHAATINEDFQVLSQIVRNKHSEEFIEKWIREKQRTTYIRINPEWVNCEFKYPGWVKD
ncbi:MAG: peptidylprolyl isomerase [Bacteroidaceae bacterium]|nr:peptidylprolyl isomerase [Bacteroidaceae bacterium]